MAQYNVMVVDDSDEILFLWKAMKRQLGIARLDCFKRLEDVIAEKIDPSAYDVCFIDKNVAGSQYGGAEMLKFLKENGAKRVVLATGELEEEVMANPAFSAADKIITEKIPTSLQPLVAS